MMMDAINERFNVFAFPLNRVDDIRSSRLHHLLRILGIYDTVP
jgi:hypothetical protein